MFGEKLLFLLYLKKVFDELNNTCKWKTAYHSRVRQLLNAYSSLYDLHGSNFSLPLFLVNSKFTIYIPLWLEFSKFLKEYKRSLQILNHVWKYTWWRHQMEIFSALLAICAGNSPASGEFPTQRPVARSFDVFFDVCLNKRLRKQSWGWWFETLSRPLWRHCNDTNRYCMSSYHLLRYPYP